MDGDTSLGEKILWKKGERAKSQSEVYGKLSPGYVIFFFQEGDEWSKDFVIEMATDALKNEEFSRDYQKIVSRVEEESRGRKICRFNL